MEKPAMFSFYISELYRQSNGQSGSFTICPYEAQSYKGKIELIVNPFELDLNSKEIMNAVLNRFRRIAVDENHYMDTNTLLQQISRYFSEILHEFGTELHISDGADIASLFKSATPEFDDEYDSTIERIVSYLKITNDFFPNRLFIFVNLRSYLSYDEMHLLKRDILYNKYNILMIESSLPKCEEDDLLRLVDTDLCERQIGGDKIFEV